jgi:hypothetical protein
LFSVRSWPAPEVGAASSGGAWPKPTPLAGCALPDATGCALPDATGAELPDATGAA